ncbi:MAG: 1-acyl-sn-glycerol-3-phosphate acyltransferase [Phormidesmis sp. RL_2_1]|nr:1-acyl-sn-glycerol-3-phosphate acyltransferase [Phormidesmis sp. RL_2_1]
MADSQTVRSVDSASTSLVSDGRTHQKAFYPPQQWPLMIRLVQSVSYPLAQVLYKFRLSSISEVQVGRVRAVDNARLVFICNHPTMEDGISLFVLSARLGQLFHYIVAHESFQGLMGWFIQRLGCYSIRRGMGDRASISETLTLLKQSLCRIVIFPEGGCSYQNDTVMPFRPGAIQLPMSALAQQAKKAASLEDVSDLYVVPLSLKYRYLSPVHRVIEATLSRLEAELMISASSKDPYHRLRQVAHRVILAIENEAHLPHDQSLDWNQRIHRLRQVFIQKCEAALDLAPNLNVPIRERVYRVQSMLEEAEISDDRSKALYWDTVRLLNFDAIYDGYVAESPTQERFLDTLMRLEREVFHLEHAQPKAPRKACFYIGEPINLKDYLADYQRDRTGTIEQLAEQLRNIVQTNLDAMNRDAHML